MDKVKGRKKEWDIEGFVSSSLAQVVLPTLECKN